MSCVAIDYCNNKCGRNVVSKLNHLVREIGEIAFAMEKNNVEHAKMEITESAALLFFLASKFNLDLETSINKTYSRKLENVKSARKA